MKQEQQQQNDRIISLSGELSQILLNNRDVIKNISIQADRIKLKLRKSDTKLNVNKDVAAVPESNAERKIYFVKYL